MNSTVQKIILVLLAANLLVSAGLFLRQQKIVVALSGVIEQPDQQDSPVTNPTSKKQQMLPRQQVEVFAERVLEAYNMRDAKALYALYTEEAQAKLGLDALNKQLASLHDLFGAVRNSRYLNNIRLGEMGTEQYFQAHFAVSVSREEARNPQLMLHLVLQDGELGLYGMRLNAAR